MVLSLVPQYYVVMIQLANKYLENKRSERKRTYDTLIYDGIDKGGCILKDGDHMEEPSLIRLHIGRCSLDQVEESTSFDVSSKVGDFQKAIEETRWRCRPVVKQQQANPRLEIGSHSIRFGVRRFHALDEGYCLTEPARTL